ncbi:MAG TPA: translation elongation factor Ts [Armatimonadota bacterium]|nr:translation elongation factor Ts [Armatimonadota bacterium]
MADISASLVMELRNKTGAKMMDAKRALVEADGDMARAVALLRERGEAEAGKRQHRATAEGTVATAQAADHAAASLVELNCETDFVAKTDEFQALAARMAGWLLGARAERVSADALPEDAQAAVTAAISKTGENILFRRGVRFATADGVVESYIHLGGKIGVLVQIDGCACDLVRALAKDLAMQVAAAVPEYLAREDVPASVIAGEMEIYRNQALAEGKKEEFLDRIAAGRLEKFFKDTCLLEQPFIKDADKTIKGLVAEVAKAVGQELTLVRFVRFQLGQ